MKRAQNVPQLAVAARDGNRVDAIAAIKSHIGLQDEQDEVGLPTVGRLNDTRVEYEAALDEFAVTADLQREDELTSPKCGVSAAQFSAVRSRTLVRASPKCGVMSPSSISARGRSRNFQSTRGNYHA